MILCPLPKWTPLSLLLITAPFSLSLLRRSRRFSSRYLAAHLHQSADGFRGR